MKIVWALGRAAESHVRKSLIDALGKHKFYGKWSCKCGSTTHKGTYSKVHCNSCNSHTNIYNEFTILDDGYLISGNPDLIFIDDNTMTIIEIKSINKKDFDKLEAPVMNHAIQSSRYVYLLRRLGFKVNTESKVIYVCKDYLFGVPYKEYSIDTSLPRYKLPFDEEIEQLLKFNSYRTTNEIPKRELCNSALSPMAKKCPSCNSCFSRDTDV